jgi:hypothetical protein
MSFRGSFLCFDLSIYLNFGCLSHKTGDFWKVQGQNRDISGFMDPKEVAGKIVHAVLNTKGMIVSDITINRKV